MMGIYPAPIRRPNLNDLNLNTIRYVAERHEDEEGDSSGTGSSFGEGSLVDDEDSFSRDKNGDADLSNGSENAWFED